MSIIVAQRSSVDIGIVFVRFCCNIFSWVDLGWAVFFATKRSAKQQQRKFCSVHHFFNLWKISPLDEIYMKKGKTILRRQRKPLQEQGDASAAPASPTMTTTTTTTSSMEEDDVDNNTDNNSNNTIQSPPTSPSHPADPSKKKSTLVFRPRKVNWERPLLIFRPQELHDVKIAQRHMSEFGQSYGFVGSSTISKTDFSFVCLLV